MFQGMCPREKSVLLNRTIEVVEISLGRAAHKTVGVKTIGCLWKELRGSAREYSSSNPAEKKEVFLFLSFVKFLSRNYVLGVHASKEKFETDFDWFVRNVSQYGLFKLYLGCLMLRAHIELASTYGNLSPFRRVELFVESGAVDSYFDYLKNVRRDFVVMDMLSI